MGKYDYSVKKLKEDIYIFTGSEHECFMYAVKGSERVLLIDTGLGMGNLHTALESIAPGLPVMAVNTHCHSDHCGGNRQFEAVYLHEGAFRDADAAEEEKKTLITEAPGADIPDYDWKRIPVKEGDTFDLGGKTIEVIETFGHTPGCISLLDKEDRVLFTGDLVCGKGHCTHMLAYVEWFSFSTVSIETYLRSLKKVLARADEFDFIAGGHDDFLMEKKYLEQSEALCLKILSGTAEAYHPVLPPVYGSITCWKAESEDTAILYQDESIFDKNKRGNEK